MPRQARAKHPQQAGPYLLRPKPPMAQVQYMPGHIANMPGHLRFDSWSSTRSNRSSGPSSATYNPRHHGPLPPMDLIPPLSATSTTHTITPSQSGPWSAEEDKILLHARSRSIGWEKVHQEYFPTKTPNACRKRYERLMQKRKANDWDDQRLEALALAYRDHREQMWRILGDRLGERWEHVEKACMDKGIKTLNNLAANHTRVQQAAHRRTVSANHVGIVHTNAPPVIEASYPPSAFEDSLNHDDSGIALSVGSRRSSGSGGGGGMMPGWSQLLHQQGN